MSTASGTRRGPGRPPLAGNEQTKSRILHVALRAFAEQGYEGVSVRSVADQSAVTPATVTYHFPGKDELYRAACVEAVDRAYAALAAATRGCASLSEELAAMCACAGRLLVEDPAPVRLLTRAHLDFDHPPIRWPDMPASARTFFDGIVDRAIARGEVEPTGRTTLEVTLQLLLWGSVMVGLNPEIDSSECEAAVHAILHTRQAPSHPSAQTD